MFCRRGWFPAALPLASWQRGEAWITAVFTFLSQMQDLFSVFDAAALGSCNNSDIRGTGARVVKLFAQQPLTEFAVRA